MKCIINEKMKPEFSPVALLWSNEKPEDALEFRQGSHSCVMYPFARVAAEGKTAVFSAETTGCPGAISGFGFGNGYYNAFGGAGVEFMACFFSKGSESAKDPVSYEKLIEHVPKNEKEKFTKGERLHSSREKAVRWMTEEFPSVDIPKHYVILKPLSEVNGNEKPVSVIFIVNPLQISALTILVGSVCEGTEPVTAPPAAACQQIGAYVYREAKAEKQRAVIGFTDLAARKNIRKTLGDDILTFAVPYSLFVRMEKEAEDGVFDGPIWRDLVKEE
ncbi:hypothetical protein F1737_01435 [Methanoplanus sp. FWC-SCC4]|uniref:DUF169 domain-containing protein n=1 Tax=Methanochimaera problematica TaxID=2609417 RepID=A0AA97I2B1_9EURY|nr:DUF169 domain-containing protein [Methanoplanus sp. FWC-SCC4]WOF15433.1 hypothetical protein F1737_01435 [Methanoplanus sp. FWC-SCC4]